MPPCKYVIRLTGKEKRELRQLRRSSKTESRLVDRARLLLWAHDGVTIDESAARLGCGRATVIFGRRRFLVPVWLGQMDWPSVPAAANVVY